MRIKYSKDRLEKRHAKEIKLCGSEFSHNLLDLNSLKLLKKLENPYNRFYGVEEQSKLNSLIEHSSKELISAAGIY